MKGTRSSTRRRRERKRPYNAHSRDNIINPKVSLCTLFTNIFLLSSEARGTLQKGGLIMPWTRFSHPFKDTCQWPELQAEYDLRDKHKEAL